ncbi:MAG: C1 family peptidase [Chloroflexia bacterium]|nr:C1 family peptidase [Chloroflexia bacterium]
MKPIIKNLSYWFIASFFAIAVMFSSCSKEENFGPETQAADEVTENVDFSAMVGGYIPTPKDVYEKIPLASDPVLKSTQAVKYLTCPSVGNQGADGACVGWATAYAARSIMTGAQTYFSPAYVYNQIKISDCASGSYPVDAINLIYNQGVCTWSYMPYQSGYCYTQPNSSQRQNAANYKISGAYRVNINYSSIRSQIAAGRPVVVAGRVDNAFQNLGYNRILNYVSGSGGGHAYCVVGYNDDYRCFRILNSWGTSWSTNGYGWISYDIVGQLCAEAYVMY